MRSSRRSALRTTWSATFHERSIVSPDVGGKHSGGVFLKSCNLLHKCHARAELAWPNWSRSRGGVLEVPNGCHRQDSLPPASCNSQCCRNAQDPGHICRSRLGRIAISGRARPGYQRRIFMTPLILQGFARDPVRLFRSFAAHANSLNEPAGANQAPPLRFSALEPHRPQTASPESIARPGFSAVCVTVFLNRRHRFKRGPPTARAGAIVLALAARSRLDVTVLGGNQ
jgi:hypothetical protein